jgi:glycosyltransferase involved in cell wall biosynthesis
VLTASVIIPTRDGRGPLRTCLRALVPGFPRDAETIVVSDNGSGGGKSDLATMLGDLVEPLALRVLEVPHGGPAFARNRGLEIARGRVAVFTDDDCRPRAGWLDTLVSRVSSSPPSAAGGLTFNGIASNPYADAAQVVLDLVARHERNCCGEVRFFPTNNCAFPTEALRHLGGFDESFRTAEDRDLLRRWRAAGHGMSLAADAVVDHEADPDFAGFVLKFFGYGRGAARFHARSSGGSYRDSASFHRRLPVLVVPELKRRGPRRGASLLALLALWEAANLAGFVAETTRRAFTFKVTVPNASPSPPPSSPKSRAS